MCVYVHVLKSNGISSPENDVEAMQVVQGQDDLPEIEPGSWLHEPPILPLVEGRKGKGREKETPI